LQNWIIYNHILVHTGQNFDYELNEIFFTGMGIRKPDYFLEAAGSSPALTIANVIMKSDELFNKEQPDALLIYGDTNSCLVVIPAKDVRYQFFTWKLVIVVLTSVYRRKSTVK